MFVRCASFESLAIVSKVLFNYASLLYVVYTSCCANRRSPSFNKSKANFECLSQSSRFIPVVCICGLNKLLYDFALSKLLEIENTILVFIPVVCSIELIISFAKRKKYFTLLCYPVIFYLDICSFWMFRI